MEKVAILKSSWTEWALRRQLFQLSSLHPIMLKSLYESIQAISNFYIATMDSGVISIRHQKKERISKSIWIVFSKSNEHCARP